MDAWSTARAEALWNHEYSGTERPRERQYADLVRCFHHFVISPIQFGPRYQSWWA